MAQLEEMPALVVVSGVFRMSYIINDVRVEKNPKNKKRALKEDRAHRVRTAIFEGPIDYIYAHQLIDKFVHRMLKKKDDSIKELERSWKSLKEGFSQKCNCDLQTVLMVSGCQCGGN